MNKEQLNHRIKNAVILLSNGHSFKVGDFRFDCIGKTRFSVTGWTTKNSLKDLTKQSALVELEEVKTLFLKMTDSSTELYDFIKEREIDYHLDFDDYGKGSIAICGEVNGHIKWQLDLP
jgi:hypothetical protein